jgi:hypothetical protein
MPYVLVLLMTIDVVVVKLVLTSSWTSRVPLPLLLYLRGWACKEGNQVGYNMILIRTLSLPTYFTCIFIDIIIYALGSTPWSSGIFWMVGWVIADPSLGLLSLWRVVPWVPILVTTIRRALSSAMWWHTASLSRGKWSNICVRWGACWSIWHAPIWS